MQWDTWSPKELNKEEIFRDYVSRYQYDDINKALDDFNEIFKVIDSISSALQWMRYNNIDDYGDLETQAVYIYQLLARDNVLILNYPFEMGDRHVSFTPGYRGD